MRQLERGQSPSNICWALALDTEECVWEKGSLKPPMAWTAPCSYNRNSSAISHKHTLTVWNWESKGKEGRDRLCPAMSMVKLLQLAALCAGFPWNWEKQWGGVRPSLPSLSLGEAFPPLSCVPGRVSVRVQPPVQWSQSDVMKKTKIISSEWPDSKSLLHFCLALGTDSELGVSGKILKDLDV